MPSRQRILPTENLPSSDSARLFGTFKTQLCQIYTAPRPFHTRKKVFAVILDNFRCVRLQRCYRFWLAPAVRRIGSKNQGLVLIRLRHRPLIPVTVPNTDQQIEYLVIFKHKRRFGRDSRRQGQQRMNRAPIDQIVGNPHPDFIAGAVAKEITTVVCHDLRIAAGPVRIMKQLAAQRPVFQVFGNRQPKMGGGRKSYGKVHSV